MNSEHEPLTFAQRAALGRTDGDLRRAAVQEPGADVEAADGRPRISTWRDTFALLAIAAGFDGRERGEGEARAWLEIFRGYPAEDVRAAVLGHYRTSPYPVMPAHVTRILEEGLPQ